MGKRPRARTVRELLLPEITQISSQLSNISARYTGDISCANSQYELASNRTENPVVQEISGGDCSCYCTLYDRIIKQPTQLQMRFVDNFDQCWNLCRSQGWLFGKCDPKTAQEEALGEPGPANFRKRLSLIRGYL